MSQELTRQRARSLTLMLKARKSDPLARGYKDNPTAIRHSEGGSRKVFTLERHKSDGAYPFTSRRFSDQLFNLSEVGQ
ncbi:hypothetical protein GCM10007857_83860 [Bradyrhizobium iriomotense]|uniref:Uncharacterized protein n=1 Tax=Bradyrhizobium iriomotense TaxID=441950 RepID=A0ABQ6BD20_9BRAD|nr:hypothetical protein GCM10007857_83860 [Bradyrhizobium iriomotense]